MSEKRFKLIKEATLQYPICENEIQLSENQIVDLLNSQNREINILQQRINILRDEIQSTVYILKMQTRKLEGY